ncbi:MAG: gene transfer agent family protein [Rhodobiaceae bacterium]|nr:gene transfer agent family protein [Rhodobiaceae bacterium]
MVNRHRGEVELRAGDKVYTLCLTLGALAHLESVYGGEDILSLADRFSRGHLTSADALNLLEAGLKGGGHEYVDLDLESMSFEGGVASLIRTLADLLRVTFGGSDAAGIEAAEANINRPEEGGEDLPPFPGSPS